ncbi:enoyl-CoA hydratase [Frigidibacter albus]|uniref:Enoyl-CoA hydratase n=1 Tax=Frigidibacter albus TaxID=1465486 RepID=A0A6L8VPL1_9RHOB|nr:enoyl-CoA hydratase-related protein [Frigidibacter albus]MZQ91110.1 enoyl-CoA hydratase [Frigidibacter albus]NBE32995.1 enoyl-CoA hydratase [Frigidibacter albus]GGH62829.1 enoyl-CoA hydratase [Frigidibacter albus]
MDFHLIRFEIADHIATITLNRPEKMNALTPAMPAEIIRAFDLTDDDDSVRAVMVTGAGRAFCAGADLSSGKDVFDKSTRPGNPQRADGRFDYTLETARDGGGTLALRIFRSLKPVIAAINGPAVGIGSAMTLPMDIRIASDTARMGFVYGKFGIVFEGCSSYFLPRAVGMAKALEWAMTARNVPAPELAEAGMFNHLVRPEELMPKARAIAAEIAASIAPVSAAVMRQMIWRGQAMRHPMEAHRVESWGITNRGMSADTQEGAAAFREKRPPAFPGKVSTDMPDYYPWWDEPEYRGPPL